jgi:hypothetical protein
MQWPIGSDWILGPTQLRTRRNRDRYLQKRKLLLNVLTRFRLMPAEEEARQDVARFDPYALRAAGLERRLAPQELGRLTDGHCGYGCGALPCMPVYYAGETCLKHTIKRKE